MPGGEQEGGKKIPAGLWNLQEFRVLGVITPKPQLTQRAVQGDPILGLIFCSEFSLFSPH